MRCHALGQHWWVVAAFESADEPGLGERASDIAHRFGKPSEIFCFQSQRANGIFTVAVEPSADQHQFRHDARGEVFQLSAEERLIIGPRCTERDWHVASEAETVACAGFVAVAGSRVKGPTMYGEEPNTGVVVKDRLRAVAVVNVPIDDENTLQAQRETRCSGQGNIVEQAKPHRALGERVMSRRADEAQCLRIGAVDDSPYRVAQRPGCQSRDFYGCRRHDRVWVRAAAPLVRKLLQCGSVLGIVRALQLCVCRWLPSGACTVLEEPLEFEVSGNGAQPLGTLGVLARVVPQKVGMVVQQCHRGNKAVEEQSEASGVLARRLLA